MPCDQPRNAGLEEDNQQAGDDGKRHDAPGIDQAAAPVGQLPGQKTVFGDEAGQHGESIEAGVGPGEQDQRRRGLYQDVEDLSQPPAAERLAELKLPTLVIVGDLDTDYIQAAADHMVAQIAGARKVVISPAAHLPNMEHPTVFNQYILDFLTGLG